MGQMGPIMGSPEIMGTMMSIHAEIMGVMGQMMQEHGDALGEANPELRQQMQNEMMQRMGEILVEQGTALKEKAKASSK
jgi:ClpP class serine protease